MLLFVNQGLRPGSFQRLDKSISFIMTFLPFFIEEALFAIIADERLTFHCLLNMNFNGSQNTRLAYTCVFSSDAPRRPWPPSGGPARDW